MSDQPQQPLYRIEHHLERLTVLGAKSLFCRPSAIRQADVLCCRQDVVQLSFEPAELS